MGTDCTNNEKDNFEKTESRLSEISLELNHVIKVYHEYLEKQRNLRMYIKSEDFKKISIYKQERVKRTIRENRGILCGIQFYTKQLNNEKKTLQRSYSENMKKKEHKTD
jgi:hypothetical protein